MIAAPIQCDVDGVPKGSHFGRVTPTGYTGRCVAQIVICRGLSWSGLLVRTPRRLGRCARTRRCCGPLTVFRTPRSLVGARPRRSLSVGGVVGSPRREPLRWGAFGRGVAALMCSATMLWNRSCMTRCTRCPRGALRAGQRGRWRPGTGSARTRWSSHSVRRSPTVSTPVAGSFDASATSFASALSAARDPPWKVCLIWIGVPLARRPA